MPSNLYTSGLKDNLWNNPLIPADSLTPEQREKLKSNGEHMYNQMNFEQLEDNIIESVAYITLQLKSGMHPSYLTKEEQDIMKQVYGKGWESEYVYKIEK